MSNFHFLKKDLEWKIVKTQCPGPTTHTPHNPQMAPYHLLSWVIVQERTIYPCILTSCAKRTYTLLPFCSPFSVSLLYSFKRENIPFLGVQKWVTNWDMSGDYTCTPLLHSSPFVRHYFLSWTTTQERKLHTPLLPLSGNSRNEWQIEIWVTNHFKILSAYYTWTLSWTTYYYLTIPNNPFGEKNNYTFSIALGDPSSISTNVLCIFALTIIPTSFPILLLYNGYALLSTTMTREKRILIWLLINYLIKLTN